MATGGAKVYKKCSSNGKITAYLGKRDFVDHTTHIDVIDGVVLIDPEYVNERKVFVKLVCGFRYGREDLDVLGVTFQKDFHIIIKQIYPPESEDEKEPKTKLQEGLVKKLGENAYPFCMEIPANSPCSVTLQPAVGDTRKPCGVDYELKAYVAEKGEEVPHKSDSVRFAIRKVQYAPDNQGPQPTAEIKKEFRSGSPLCLEASLDKELYYHDETINVNVQVTNNSSKLVKKVKITVNQVADICLFQKAQYECPVASVEADDQIAPSSTLCKVYQICPKLQPNKDKRGLALDGQLKREDTNLASSTIMKDGLEPEDFGIIVQYNVKVKLVIGGLGGGECCLELPLSLMHPMPETDPEAEEKATESGNGTATRKPNLVCVDVKGEVEDLVFQDFARMRLKNT